MQRCSSASVGGSVLDRVELFRNYTDCLKETDNCNDGTINGSFVPDEGRILPSNVNLWPCERTWNEIVPFRAMVTENLSRCYFFASRCFFKRLYIVSFYRYTIARQGFRNGTVGEVVQGHRKSVQSRKRFIVVGFILTSVTIHCSFFLRLQRYRRSSRTEVPLCALALAFFSTPRVTLGTTTNVNIARIYDIARSIE